MEELEKIVQQMLNEGRPQEEIDAVILEFQTPSEVKPAPTTPGAEVVTTEAPENTESESEDTSLASPDPVFEINEDLSDLKSEDVVKKLRGVYDDNGFEFKTERQGLATAITVAAPTGQEKTFDGFSWRDSTKAKSEAEKLQMRKEFNNNRNFEIESFIRDNKDDEIWSKTYASTKTLEAIGNEIMKNEDWRSFGALQSSFVKKANMKMSDVFGINQFIEPDREGGIENINSLQKDPDLFQDFEDNLRSEILKIYQRSQKPGEDLVIPSDYQVDKIVNNVVSNTIRQDKAFEAQNAKEDYIEFQKKRKFTETQASNYLKGVAVDQLKPEQKKIASLWSMVSQLNNRQEQGTSDLNPSDAIKLSNELKKAQIEAQNATQAYLGEGTKSWFNFVDGVAINNNGATVPEDGIDISTNVKINQEQLAELKNKDFNSLQQNFNMFQVEKINLDKKLNQTYSVSVNGPKGRFFPLGEALNRKGYKEQDGVFKDVSLRDMVSLSQYQSDTFGNFDNIDPEDKKGNNISQGSLSDYVNIVSAQVKANQAMDVAYNDIYLMNIDPGSIKRSSFGRSALEANPELTLGIELGVSRSENLKVIEEIMINSGINPSTQQAKNFEKTFIEEAGELLGGLPLVVVEFGIAGGGVTALGGLKALGNINKLQKSYQQINTFASRTKALTISALKESITMEIVTGDGTTGAGFAVAGNYFNRINKLMGGLKFTNKASPLNQLLLQPLQGGLSFTTASQASSFLSGMTEDYAGGKDFKTFMEEKFPDIPFFDEGGIGREYAKEFLTGVALRVGKIKKLDIQLLMGKGNSIKNELIKQYNIETELGPGGKGGKNKKKIQELKEAINYVDAGLNQFHEDHVDIDPELRASRVNSEMLRIQTGIEKETGKEFDFEVRQNGVGMDGKTAEFFPKTSKNKAKIIIDASKINRGKIPHEILHFISAEFKLNSPESMGKIRNAIEPAINKAMEELGIEDFDLKQLIKEKYKDQDKTSRPEEYIANIIELLRSEPKFRNVLVSGTILGDLKQKVTSIIERRFKGTALEGQLVDFTPTEFLQFLDRLGADIGKVGSGRQIAMLENLSFDGKRIFNTSTGDYKGSLAAKEIKLKSLEIAKTNKDLNKKENLVENDKGELVPNDATKKKLIENNMRRVIQLANEAARNPNILGLEQSKRISVESWTSGYNEQLVKLVNSYRPESTPGDFGAYMNRVLPKRYGNVLTELKKGEVVDAQSLDGIEVRDEQVNTFENEDLSIGNRNKLSVDEIQSIEPIFFLTKGNKKEGDVLESAILKEIDGVDLSKKTYSDLIPSNKIIDAVGKIFAGGDKLKFQQGGAPKLTPEGKLDTFKANKEVISSQKEFIRNNAKELYDMLPYAAKMAAEGLKSSTKIQPVLVRNLYEKGSRVNVVTGTTAGLSKQVKPAWSPKIEKKFLKLFGANKGATPSRNQITAINALIRETAKSTLNSVARKKSLTKNDIALYQQLADGKSDALASLNITLPKGTVYNMDKLKAAAALMAQGKFDEASRKYPIEQSIAEVFNFERKYSETIDKKEAGNPTTKKLADEVKNVIIETKFGPVNMSEIYDGVTGTGMRKVQTKSNVIIENGKKVTVKEKLGETYNIDRITEQINQAKSWASTLPKKLNEAFTKTTLTSSLGSGTYATASDIKNIGKTPKTDIKTGKEVSGFDIIKNQSSQLLEAIGTGKNITNAFEGLLDGNQSGIGQQKTSFKNLLTKGKTEQEKIDIIKRTVNPKDNKLKKEIYSAFQTSLQEWLYSSKDRQQFVERAKFIAQSAADNTSLVMGFARQFVPIEAVLFESNKKITAKEKQKLKVEHLKSSLKQSFEAATAVIEGKWTENGDKIMKDYTAVLSYKKYLDVIDTRGGTTNMGGRDRMTLDFENLKKYKTVASDYEKTLYDQLLQDYSKELGINVKRLGEKYLKDELALYGFTQSPASKLLLETAFNNKKQRFEVLTKNEKIAKKAGIDVKDLSNIQILEKLKEKDKTNQEELISSMASRDLDLAFNEIIENKTGIGKEKSYSKAKAAVVGAKAGKIKLLASSAQDFEGLMYRTLGKGKLGDTQKKFYEEFLYRPLAQAEANLATDRVTMANNFKALKKQLKVSPKDLRKNIEGEPWSKEQAVRVHVWNKQGMTVPDLSKSDLKLLDNFVKNDPKLEAYAQELILLGKGTPYAEPGQNWEVGTITSDLIKSIQTTKRSQYLAPFISNADIMFSEKNLNKLEAGFGVKYREALENSLARIKAGKNRLIFNSDSGSKLENRVLDYINNSTGAIMFFNTRSAVLQTLSAANFLNFKENNPLAAGKAFANQPQYWKDFSKLMNSDYLVDRRQGIKLNVAEAEIADAVHDQTNKPKAALNYILRKGFLPTQFADSFAIASGGATYYRNRIKMYEKQGLTTVEAEKKAYLDFMDTAEKSQQSSKAQRISMQQASNLGRVVLAFANTPSQYLRLTQKATSDLLNNRGSKTENISKIAYYSVVQNLLFTTLQQATAGLLFDDDEDDAEQLKGKLPNVLSSGFDNLARGAGIAGAALVTAKAIATKIYKESEKKRPKYSEVAYELLTFSPPIRSKVLKLRSAGRTVEYAGGFGALMNQGYSLDNPAYLAGANVVSSFTNVPLDRVVKKIDNLRSAMDKQNADWQRIALIMGWGRYELGLPYKKSIVKKKEPTLIKY